MEQPTNAELIDQLGVGTGTFAAKMAEIAGAVASSEYDLQMNHLKFLQTVIDLPNITMTQVEDIGFGLGKVGRHDERSAITTINLERPGFTRVEMDFDMTVGARTTAMTEKERTIKTDTELAGSAKVAFWRMSIKQNISAEMRQGSKQTRDTDMSAAVKIHAEIGRIPSPEGVNTMSDVANEFTRKLADLRLKIATAKVDKVVKQIEEGEINPVELSEQQSFPELEQQGVIAE